MISMMRRRPYVAGAFYPGEAVRLRDIVESLIDRRAARERAVAAVVPHAGYIYSGGVAGAVYSSVEIPDTVVLLGPAHNRIASGAALYDEGTWMTPLGDCPIAARLAGRILELASCARSDPSAHAREHSLEVQLPFLQYLNPEVSIVPICLSHTATLEDVEEIGHAVIRAVEECGEEALIVASTDMSHYVPKSEAEMLDRKAIACILRLDARDLLETVRRESITMCGALPAASAVFAARKAGATSGELIRYATSADRSGDESEVVGYAGIRIK
jgi:MEMO1 family protein